MEREKTLRQVQNLIALDAQNVMERLAQRQDAMIELFSRLRDRDALLLPLASRGDSAPFADLSRLSLSQQHAVNHFYETLEHLRWYFRYTEDMPGTAATVFNLHKRSLEQSFAKLIESIGAPSPEDEPTPRPVPNRKSSPSKRRSTKRARSSRR